MHGCGFFCKLSKDLSVLAGEKFLRRGKWRRLISEGLNYVELLILIDHWRLRLLALTLTLSCNWLDKARLDRARNSHLRLSLHWLHLLRL